MKLFLQNIATFIIARLARILAPALQRHLARLCKPLSHDLPKLEDAWVVRFTNPDRLGRVTRKKIDATLHQFGRYIQGYGHFQGEPADIFEYRGVIARNVLYGSYRRVDYHVLAGTGTFVFVLKISADSRRLKGYCLWYDTVIDDVWSSEYVWHRKSLSR